MSGQISECVAYFKSRPGYHRILEQMLKKYKAYGGPVGQVSIVDATEEECEAAQALFGRPYAPPLRFKLQAFDNALQQTKFQGVTLKKLLESYFHTTIRTKKEIQRQVELDFSEMLTRVSSETQSSAGRDWLSRLGDKNDGYQLLRKSMGDRTAEPALRQACRGVDWLALHPGEVVRLAVLSARATSDPHALDGGRLAGKLFLHALAALEGRVFSTVAEDRDSLYYEAGILCDSIASSVTQVGLVLCDENGEHPAFRAFRERHESCTLTLMNLAALSSGHSPSGQAYLVENQMVFSQLCDQAKRFHSPLICTSGQPQVAVLRLLDLLATAGTQFYYSGDFDGEGLSIAARLMTRYPKLLRTWHMAPEDYARTCPEVNLPDSRLQPLRTLTDFRLTATAAAILHQKRAGYQELLLPSLLADLTATP
ncbi:TIGR02679 family protein [Intestinibacillus massiliensis]|uniref:TIGR02679 family protein n=1 Tax=Intestinibacillus massiliensis TaxID=1871029 RepID=UPI000B357AAD|nr:TIGR02679 family protein [Intestinibacillus massiliensis]